MADSVPFDARGDFIDGAFVLPAHASGEIELEDPGDTRSRLGAFPFALESVDAAVAAARRAAPAWRDRRPEERADLLRRFADTLRTERDTLAGVIALEAGKPIWEARSEVDAMVAKVDITLGDGMALIQDREIGLGPGQAARWRNRARGTLAVLGPFNFPGHLVHGHVVPALATGNTVVIKPSDRTPAVGQMYADLAARAGFPPGVVNTVQGDAASGAVLAAHAQIDGVLFTGSWSVGRTILEATLDQPWKLVVLEMGGKNGVLVASDADVEAAARAIAFGATVTCGQRCSATSRVFAERQVADQLCERLVQILGSIQIGYPIDDDVFMGPLISASARERHAQVLHLAAREGAERLLDGGPFQGPRPGHYVRPTLHRLKMLRHDSRYQGEEHFVPDLFVLPVDSVEAGIEALNATEYGLVASVFTRRREVFERVVRDCRTGLLNWNGSTVGANSRLPFGGIGRSGNDRAAGVTSTLYCTVPLASVEFDEPAPPASWPGFPAP